MRFRFWTPLLFCVALLSTTRGIFFLIYSYFIFSSPYEIFHFEAVMVYLSRRVALGLTLYPDWSQPPHIPNFYGPLDFWIVGILGRCLNAGLPGLFEIGRGVSLISALITSLLIFFFLKKRYGIGPGILGMVSSLGTAPMFGFSVMVRPDAMSETLGFAGFWLGNGRSIKRMVASGIVLALAILAKQTAGLFLLATLAALVFSRRPRDAAIVLGSCLVALLLIAVVATISGEPHLAAGLIGQARFAPSIAAFKPIIVRLAVLSPDLLVFSILGLAFWTMGKTREPDLAALTAVILMVSLATAFKPGSDLNYYLNLRIVEPLVIGKLWSLTRTAKGQAVRGLVFGLVLGTLSLVPGVRHAAMQVLNAKKNAENFAGPLGIGRLRVQDRLFRFAADPKLNVLSDSGIVALHQGERAAFSDPWMFRALVTTGQIEPKAIEERLLASGYDYLILTSPLGPEYESYEFGLPPKLARIAAGRYVHVDTRLWYFIYEPKTLERSPSQLLPATK